MKLLLLALLASQVATPWVNEPSDAQIQKTPGLVHETLESEFMKTTVGYSVVLPPSYKQSDQRFPVVYWLHGGGGNECSSLFTAKSWQQLRQSSQINEAILVYPNGARSGYMDHHDGEVMVESMFIKELIPRIDHRYRTIASSAGRAAHGFSMGASGSLKFAIKYPDLFCSVVAYGGGAIDLANTKRPFVIKILEQNLAMDATLIQQNNTYHCLQQNHRIVRENRMEFLLITGSEDSWKDTAFKFQSALQTHGIPCQLKIVPDVGHDIGRLMKAEGVNAAAFQDRVFKKRAN